MDNFGYYEGLGSGAALAVVVSTVVLYVAFVLLLHVARPRLFASPSTLDLAVVTVMGAVVGRAILGRVPTLAAGLLALLTLVAVRLLAGLVASRAPATPVTAGATLLMVAGEVDHAQLRRHGLTMRSLWSVLREHGVAHPDDVFMVVLERSGRFSVLRSGARLHRDALTGVGGAEGLLTRFEAALGGEPG